MNRIPGTLARLRRQHRRAFIPFVVAGDPNARTTESLVLALTDAGADIVELGLPFSDPLADGPTIQRASARALAAGTTPRSTRASVSVSSVRPCHSGAKYFGRRTRLMGQSRSPLPPAIIAAYSFISWGRAATGPAHGIH